MLVLYYSPSCANSRRALDIMNRIPSFRGKVAYTDVNTLPPAERSGLQFVPTVVDQSGRQYVGTQAFEFLKQYEGEMELEYEPMASGRLTFSSIGGLGESEYTEMFGDFVKPS